MLCKCQNSPYFQDLQIENELKIEIKIELEIDTY
jgi:hypothetical protein